MPMSLVRITAALGFAASAAVSSAPAPSHPADAQIPDHQPSDTVWHVAQRVDDDRVVVLFGGHELFMPQREFEKLPVLATTRTRTPGRLFELPADRVQAIVGDKARVGDRWILDAGRRGRFRFSVEQLVLGYKDCGEAWGVLARVAADGAPAFAGVSEKYYVARRAQAEVAPPLKTRIGPVAFALDADRRVELSALLEHERQRTWPELQREASQDYARAEAHGQKWHARWRRLDGALDRGEAQLGFDVQAFRLTPDGDPRLFVRARWTLSGALVYGMTAWIRVSGRMAVERSDAKVAGWLRMGEFQRMPFDNELFGLVLNVVDTNGDGFAEILMLQSGDESRNVIVIDAPGAPGGRRDPFVDYSDGC